MPNIIVVRLTGPNPDNDKELMLQHLEVVHGMDRRKLEAEGHEIAELMNIHEVVIAAEEARERAAPLN